LYSYSSLLCDARFHNLLLAFDRDLAAVAREAGCGRCSGVLHCAGYWRKPRGRACIVGPEHDRRFSFCCAVDGCRRRATPPSLRFLGRKVYLATVVVLVSMMQHGVTEPRVRRLAAVVGVDAVINLRDICGLGPTAIEDTLAWTARSIVRATLDDPPAGE